MCPFWILLELRMTEAVMMTGAELQDVQNSSQTITINKPTPSFHRLDVLPVAQPKKH